MEGELIRDKKIRIKNILGAGTHIITDTLKGIVITDLLISKKNEGRVMFRMNDGKRSEIFLELNNKGTRHFSFNNGLSFWKGANLEVIKELNNECIITCGYYIDEKAKDKSIWDL